MEYNKIVFDNRTLYNNYKASNSLMAITTMIKGDKIE